VDLFGKVVLVTGAGGNLGSACAREMARQGARVVVSDLPGSGRLEGVAVAIREEGGEAIIHQVISPRRPTSRSWSRSRPGASAASMSS
jgi:NAD(P)-dependent dehydrogenase (short-subunit alcohol dehydrogenase family)